MACGFVRGNAVCDQPGTGLQIGDQNDRASPAEAIRKVGFPTEA